MLDSKHFVLKFVLTAVPKTTVLLHNKISHFYILKDISLKFFFFIFKDFSVVFTEALLFCATHITYSFFSPPQYQLFAENSNSQPFLVSGTLCTSNWQTTAAGHLPVFVSSFTGIQLSIFTHI